MTLALIQSLLEAMWRASWQAAVLVPVVLLLQWLFRKRLSPASRHALWWIVVARLALPFTPSAPCSVFNTLPPAPSRWTTSAVEPSAYQLPSVPGRQMPPTLPENLAPPSPAATVLLPEVLADAAAPVTAFPTTALPSPQPVVRYTLPAVLFSVWLLGVLVLCLQLTVGQYRFHRQLRRARPLSHPAAADVLAHARQLTRVEAPIVLLETAAVDGPAIHNPIRPRILLPPGLADRLNPDELLHIFLHELAHVRRRDLWTQWILTAVQIVHWFNPAVWWALARMSTDREIACDALALAASRDTPSRDYGRTLLKLADETQTFAAVPGVLGVVENPSELQQRIHMIATFRHHPTKPVLALALMATLGVLFLTDAATPQAPSRNPPEPQSTGTEPAESATQLPLPIFRTNPIPPTGTPYSSLMADGRLLFEMGNLAEAEQKFRQAKSLRPEDPDPDHHLRLIADQQTASPIPLERDWIPARPTPPAAADGLDTRIYRINTYSIEEGFDSLVSSVGMDPARPLGAVEQDTTRPGTVTSTDTSPSSGHLAERFRTLFRVVGVSFEPPSPNVFMFKPSTGVLMVCASTPDLDRIEKALEFINVAPAQITIEVKLVEISQQDTRELGFDWFLGNTLVGPGTAPTYQGSPSAANPSGVFPGAFGYETSNPPVSLTGILTAAQYRTVIRALENRGGTETLFAPKVTTLSGRQTRITVQNAMTVNLLPVVLANGYSIDLMLDLQIARDFATAANPTAAGDQQLEITTKAIVWTAQTLVLGGLITSPSNQPGDASAERTRKNLVVFITPTIVDPAGNPVHTPDMLPYDPNAIRR
jgi:beta-lactamase regulating signal transducer with metallopeptidase domain